MTPSHDEPPSAAARIVGTYGYRIEGDTASLNAEIHWRPQAADHDGWQLELWARPLGSPAPAVRVAVLALRVPLHSHGEPQQYAEGHVMAVPPAGSGQHDMALRLVSTGADGRPLLHDQAAFEQPERFVQPRLEGASLHDGVGSDLALVVERVHNPRPADNVSGSLSLELWALAGPYHGGPFIGRCITSARVEPLAGQAEAGPLVLPVPATAADHQRAWCLMLREWTAVGYVTRDHLALVPPLPARAAAQGGTAGRGPAAQAGPATPAAQAGPANPASRPPAARPAVAHAASSVVAPAAGKPARRRPGAVPAAGLGPRLMANLRQLLHRG